MACSVNRRGAMANPDETARDRLDGIFGTWEPDSRKSFYALIVASAIVMWGVTFVASVYLIKILYVLYMYITFGVAWNYLSGYTGYPTFGPMMFIGIGGYVTAALTVHAGMTWYAAIIVTTVIAAAVAVVFGYILLRLSGIYFAIGTLLVAEALREAVLLLENIFGGSSGINLATIPLSTTYVLFAVLALGSIVITYETATSRFGLRMLAVREDEEALKSLGVNPIRYKVPAFVVHGVLTSLAGSLFALSLGFLFPTTVFSLDITITLILIAILGGMGTVWGPVIGALILIPIQEVFWLQFPTLHVIAYGVFLIAVIILMPEGIMERLKKYDIIPESRGV
jgi:branched-chain amino acid transport system permease protein